MKVLIVDDDRTIVALLRDVLADLGHDVASRTSGPDAIAYATTHEPDVVFLDVLMPRLSGLEVLNALRQLPHRPYVVLVTAMSEQTLERMAGSHRADALLAKPFRREDVERAMERARRPPRS